MTSKHYVKYSTIGFDEISLLGRRNSRLKRQFSWKPQTLVFDNNSMQFDFFDVGNLHGRFEIVVNLALPA